MLGRCQRRHGGGLAYLYNALMNDKPEGKTIYADIKGGTVNEGTIPTEIIVKNVRPNFLIIDTYYL